MCTTTLMSALLAAGLAAQEPDPSKQSPAVLVDMVVATVNDSAILRSELLTAVTGRINLERAQRGGISPQRERAIQMDQLQRVIDNRRMAQAAKTFGVITPEQVESMVQSEVEREQQERVRDLGTQSAFSRELAREGRTWPTMRNELRQQKLSEVAEDLAVNHRLARQTNLYLTPLMLRQTYSLAHDLFVHAKEARVSSVLFHGADAEAQARKAAEVWRVQGITSRELAGQFPGSTATDDLLASSLPPAQKELQDFALRGPQDNVSEPMTIAGDVYVAKITGFLAARDGRFEDPDVQQQLREICRNKVIEEFRQQALDRAKERTEVWISPQFR